MRVFLFRLGVLATRGNLEVCPHSSRLVAQITPTRKCGGLVGVCRTASFNWHTLCSKILLWTGEYSAQCSYVTHDTVELLFVSCRGTRPRQQSLVRTWHVNFKVVDYCCSSCAVQAVEVKTGQRVRLVQLLRTTVCSTLQMQVRHWNNRRITAERT